MAFGDGTSDEDTRIYFAWCIMRGQRHPELEHAYFGHYYRRDERVPRLRHLPDSQLVHNTQVYTEQERKTSAAYNELLTPHHGADAINVRLDGPNGTRIVWTINDPLDGDGWSSAQLDSVRRLLPHIRQTVRVQQALDGAGALGATLPNLLDTTGMGIVQLDGRGADRGGERPRPGSAAPRRRTVGRARIPSRPQPGGRCRTPGAVGAGAAAVRGSGRLRLDDAETRVWPAPGAARLPGGPAGGGTRGSGRSPRWCWSSTRQAKPASIRPWPIGADRAYSPADARIGPEKLRKPANLPHFGDARQPATR